MPEREDGYQNAQYIGYLPVFGLQLGDDGKSFQKNGVKLSPLARLCYGVMKGFGPEFKAGRPAVAERMGLEDTETVGRCQRELQEFGLLEAINTPGKGEMQRWRVLEPNTLRTRRVAGATGYLTKVGSRSDRVEVAGATGTKALNEAPKTTPVKINKQSKWVNPSRVLHLQAGTK